MTDDTTENGDDPGSGSRDEFNGSSDETNGASEHVIESPVETSAEQLSEASDGELEQMERQLKRSLDHLDHKLNGDGRIRDVDRAKVRCSMIRCQVKLIKKLSELYEKRELREMKRRVDELEETGTESRIGGVDVGAVIKERMDGGETDG